MFSELKQWANGTQNQQILMDAIKKNTLELKPYMELTDGDFDPIEVYAYYLGLYINNMYKQEIFLSYAMSFPVNYRAEVREKIRSSFEKGLRKSLPPAILSDEELMGRFEVYSGASEPAAYAVSALRELKLEPRSTEDRVAYAVFDFGGGTTDFDFGIERLDEKRRSHYVIDQFGAAGDPLLGGENLLNLMAYEVYKDNIAEMRAKHIPFVIPPGQKTVAGAESLLNVAGKASTAANMNCRRIAELLRVIWEEKAEADNLGKEPKEQQLFTNSKKSDDDKEIANEQTNVKLNINVDKLKKCLRDRIGIGVDNFFRSMLNAFRDKNVMPIHILLAGNSCRSSIVKELFENEINNVTEKLTAAIREKDGDSLNFANAFQLHLPLGMEEKKSADNQKVEPVNQKNTDGNTKTGKKNTNDVGLVNYDKLRTGKTGVAFGLLRSRRGGRDVRINNMNNVDNGQVKFPYLLGENDWEGNFHVCIGMDVPYNEWKPLPFYPDEPYFELYYTKEQRALDNEHRLSTDDVNCITCYLNKSDITTDENARIYMRKATPDTVEYAVATEAEIEGNIDKKKICAAKLRD